MYRQTGQRNGPGVLVDELSDTNGPAYWRSRTKQYDSSGEQKFLAGLLGLDDSYALGRGVKIPEKALEKLRSMNPKVISGGRGAVYRKTTGKNLLPTDYRLGYEMA